MQALFNDTTAKTYTTHDDAVEAITKFIESYEEKANFKVRGNYIIASNEAGQFFVIVRTQDIILTPALLRKGFCVIN